MLENENLVSISIKEKWEKVKRSVEMRIRRNMLELCTLYQDDPSVDSNTHALRMSEKRLREAMVDNRLLEAQTKDINRHLEEKFQVYTK